MTKKELIDAITQYKFELECRYEISDEEKRIFDEWVKTEYIKYLLHEDGKRATNKLIREAKEKLDKANFNVYESIFGK